MTYFNSRQSRAAFLGAMPSDVAEGLIETDLADLDAAGQPDLSLEYRDEVSASDIHPSQWED